MNNKTLTYLQLAFGIISTIYILYNLYKDFNQEKEKALLT